MKGFFRKCLRVFWIAWISEAMSRIVGFYFQRLFQRFHIIFKCVDYLFVNPLILFCPYK
jgi:hypothetical protein